MKTLTNEELADKLKSWSTRQLLHIFGQLQVDQNARDVHVDRGGSREAGQKGKGKMTESDYQRFAKLAMRLGCERVKVLGYLNNSGAPIRYEAWVPRKGPGFVLATDEATGTIGVYEFVGQDGDSVESDMKWLQESINKEKN